MKRWLAELTKSPLMRGATSSEEIAQAITKVPWTQLAHAYHSAWDAPMQLKRLTQPNPSKEALKRGIDWMWGSLLHQGTLYSASIPVLWILIDLIAARPRHPAAESILFALQTLCEDLIYRRDEGDVDLPEPLRRSAPGEPLYEVRSEQPLPRSSDDAVGNRAYFSAAQVSQQLLRELIRHAIPVIHHCLTHPLKAVRSAAVAASVGVLQVEPEEIEPLIDLNGIIGNPDYEPGSWISVAMILGARGHALNDQLNHTDRRIRLAAAMASSTATDPRSVTELAAAIAEPEWLEESFPDGAAHLDMQLRFHLLEALLARRAAASVERPVVAALCTLIRTSCSKYTVDFGWGPLLYWAFPERRIALPQQHPFAPPPARLNSVQAAILQAICENAELWDPHSGNIRMAYSRIQLPYDRNLLCRLANQQSADDRAFTPPGPQSDPL